MGKRKSDGRFAMYAWDSVNGEWRAMHVGAAAQVWRPRGAAIEAVAKCMAWTGFLFIPAMQVRDTTTGEVVWRESGKYPAAGPRVPFADVLLAEAIARAALAGEAHAPVETIVARVDDVAEHVQDRLFD